MLDSTLRSQIVPRLDRFGSQLAGRGVRAAHVTAIGFAFGIGACIAIAIDQWGLGLLLWLLNRLADGLDGAVARATRPTELGGFFDIMADFAIYGGLLVSLGISDERLRLPALVCFLAYYLNGSAFLAWSSLAERIGRREDGNNRSFEFSSAGLAEGTETIVAMSVVLLWRAQAPIILWIWAGVVALTVAQRIVFVSRHLRDYQPGPTAPK